MRLAHKCGSTVYFTASGCVQLLAEADPEGSHVRTSSLVIHQICEKIQPTELYCPQCKTVVEAKSVVARCYDCQTFLPLDKIFYTEESGGVHCESCCEKYLPQETRKVLLKCISNISIK